MYCSNCGKDIVKARIFLSILRTPGSPYCEAFAEAALCLLQRG